ncbi:MAG TPA: LPS export ABC transporter periplasmic protein LptC [Amoebophilaceae bacterium]|nr:LPS export ABC transporter periplasmic protein LptC [Amoebophilaceae bacterium]
MKNKHCFWAYFFFGIAFGFTPEKDRACGIPTLESSHIELLCSEHGVVKYRLFTDKALHYENGDRTYPEGIHIEFYESNKEVSATGRANSGYFFAEKNVYAFRGDVELKSLRDTRQLNTEELHWSPETETFYTDKFIRIETEEELLTGAGLIAKQDLSYYNISKPQGLLNVKSIK